MKILILDLMQSSDAPKALISPALADTLDRRLTSANPLTVTLDNTYPYDAVGIGNTDATTITINGAAITISTELANGLYDITPGSTRTLSISHDGSYIGRLAVGTARYLGCSPSREPGFWTTGKPRITLSGQVVPPAGSLGGRQIGLQIKYKFSEEVISDIEAAWPTISQGYPFFVSFDAREQTRMPWARMYAFAGNDLGSPFVLQSSLNKYLYSRDLTLKEAY